MYLLSQQEILGTESFPKHRGEGLCAWRDVCKCNVIGLGMTYPSENSSFFGLHVYAVPYTTFKSRIFELIICPNKI